MISFMHYLRSYLEIPLIVWVVHAAEDIGWRNLGLFRLRWGNSHSCQFIVELHCRSDCPFVFPWVQGRGSHSIHIVQTRPLVVLSHIVCAGLLRVPHLLLSLCLLFGEFVNRWSSVPSLILCLRLEHRRSMVLDINIILGLTVSKLSTHLTISPHRCQTLFKLPCTVHLYPMIVIIFSVNWHF